MEAKLFIFSILFAYSTAQILDVIGRIPVPCSDNEGCRSNIKDPKLQFKCVNNFCLCPNDKHTSYVYCEKKSDYIVGARAAVDEMAHGNCENDNDCHIKGTRCLPTPRSEHKYCQCDAYMVMNKNGTACLKIAEKIGDECRDSIQCKEGLGIAECFRGYCRCLNGSHYVDVKNTCVRDKGFGESCTKDEYSCFEWQEGPEYARNVLRCSSKNMCKCINSYKFINGTCHRSGATRLLSQISILVVLIIVTLQVV